MMLKTREREPSWVSYLTAQHGIQFINTGCVLFDCALGGGYGGGRVINVIGDRSTGKTLLMIEACANFARQYPKGLLAYREMEGAFDLEYGRLLGMPVDRMEPEVELATVEDMQKDVRAFVTRCKKKKVPGFYGLDSLDAISDQGEMNREMGDATYGTKAKALGEFFRRETKLMKQANVTFFVVSQMRDRIGVTFGRKWTRSGGRALDFYASQIIVLSEVNKITKTKHGQKRIVGVNIKAHINKNKCGLPFREAEFPIRFGYGIDDREASENYLDAAKVKFNGEVDLSPLVKKTWQNIEKSFLPTVQKYAV